VAPGFCGDGSENVGAGGTENVGDVEPTVEGCETVDVVELMAPGVAVFTEEGVVATAPGVDGGNPTVLDGVGPDVGRLPVVTGMQNGTAGGGLGVTIGPCVAGGGAWPCALPAMAEHATATITRATAEGLII
jgi:hypothetical protein